MSKVCVICGKGKVSGNNVSHSNRRTKRTFSANVHKVKVEIKQNALLFYGNAFYFLLLFFFSTEQNSQQPAYYRRSFKTIYFHCLHLRHLYNYMKKRVVPLLTIAAENAFLFFIVFYINILRLF